LTTIESLFFSALQPPAEEEEELAPELMRYLNRNYWEQQQQQQKSVAEIKVGLFFGNKRLPPTRPPFSSCSF
jgi:hypothetical protein